MSYRKASVSLLLGTLTLAGCVNLAPIFERPESPVPAELPGGATGVAMDDLIAWDQVFLSPELKELIELALDQNRDLRISAANIEVARAQYGLSRSSLLPTVGASGTVQEGGRFSPEGVNSSSFRDSALVQLGVTGYELDFFGRVRNQTEASLQSYLATVEGQRASRIAIIASVAELWVQLASDRELLALAQNTVEAQTDSFELTQELLDAGVVTALDTRRASASVQSARAQAAQYEAQVRQDINALRLVVGTSLPASLQDDAMLTPSPVQLELPVGMSSSILLNRPDVIAAERSMLAANANIGVARAAMFPSITLSGNVGYASTDLEDFFNNDVGGWTFGPSFDLPIFDYGARRSQIEVAEAQQQLALAQYESVIQTAFQETADTLAVAETIDTRVDALEQYAEDTDVTFNLSMERFRTGVDDYLSVLDAQREDYTAQTQLILARRDRALNIIGLYRALGAAPVVPGDDTTLASDDQ